MEIQILPGPIDPGSGKNLQHKKFFLFNQYNFTKLIHVTKEMI